MSKDSESVMSAARPLTLCAVLVTAGALVVYAAARVLGWAAQTRDEAMYG